MTLYELKSDGIVKIEATTFDEVGIKERSDLQRLLRERIEVIASDTLVIAEEFGQDVRIILASAKFSKELTTAVMWLNERDLDIRCIRIMPHRDGDRILIDVQQVVPLPEAQDYQVRVREKATQERTSRRGQS